MTKHKNFKVHAVIKHYRHRAILFKNYLKTYLIPKLLI